MRVVLARAELGWLASALTALQIVAATLRSSATIVIARPQRRPVLITRARMHGALAMATGEADGYCGSSGGTVRLPDPDKGEDGNDGGDCGEGGGAGGMGFEGGGAGDGGDNGEIGRQLTVTGPMAVSP